MYEEILNIIDESHAQIIQIKPNNSSLNYEQFNKLKNQLKLIDNAKKNCLSYLNKDNEEYIESKLINSQKTLNQNILITLCFEKAEFLLENMNTLYTTLGNLIFNYQSIEKTSMSLDEQIKIIKSKYINEMNLCEMYENNTNPYQINRTKSLESNLSKVATLYPKYGELWYEINDDIMHKFLTLLNKTKESNYEEKDKIINFAQLVLNSLPDTTKTSLIEEFNKCKKNIKEENKEDEDQLRTHLKYKDYEALCIMYHDVKKTKNFEMMKQIEHELFILAKNSQSDIDQAINDSDISKVDKVLLLFDTIIKIFNDQQGQRISNLKYDFK